MSAKRQRKPQQNKFQYIPVEWLRNGEVKRVKTIIHNN